MKRITIVTFFSFISNLLIEPCVAQSKDYKVTYEGTINTSELLKRFDSINVIRNGVADGKIPMEAVPLMEMPVMKLNVEIQGERVVIKRLEEAAIRNSAGLSSPDSSVFDNNNWYTYRNGQRNILASFSDTLKRTSVTKTIAGYSCVKYIWQSNFSNQLTELWVTKELPKSISPFAQNIPVEGAIIESRQLGSNFTYRLMEVKELKNDQLF